MEKITLPKKNPNSIDLLCVHRFSPFPDRREACCDPTDCPSGVHQSFPQPPAAAHCSDCSSRGGSEGPHPLRVLLSGLREQPISWPHQPLLLSCCQPRASRSMVAFRGPQSREGSCSTGKEKMEKGCMYCERFRRHEWKVAFGWGKAWSELKLGY